MTGIRWYIHDDGSYDLIGTDCRVQAAWPEVDGRALHTDALEIGNERIVYSSGSRKLSLTFVREEGRLLLKTRAIGFAGAHDISPIGSASIVGTENCFVQGMGMEGPSGYRRIGGEKLSSNGLVALDAAMPLFLYAEDHRHMNVRFTIQKAADAFGREQEMISCSCNLEGTTREDQELPAIVLEECGELAQGLRQVATRIAAAMGARHVQPPAYHWCSWYYLYQNISQAYLEQYLQGMKETGCTDFRYIQIDEGYAPSHGDWLLPSARFPGGMELAARTIRNAGFQAGIWIGPFMVGDHSQLFHDHPDWMLRSRDGSLVTELRSYNEPKTWGQVDGNYYVLDTSHPDALEYLREVFTTLRAWGFTLFKTDFMFWNMHDTSTVQRYDSSRTSFEILRDTLKVIREAIGEESYLLGCIAPFMPFIGYADGMRIAGDVGASWSEVFGPLNMIRELQADNYFNHIFWQNDPDSVLLRDFDIFLKPVEIRSLALLQAISGGAVTTSDPVHRIAPDRRELLRFIRPVDREETPEFPYLKEQRDDLVILHRLRRGNLLYALNLSDRERTFVYDYRELFGTGGWCSWRYETGENREAEDLYIGRLSPHESVLLFLTREPMDREPSNLWALED